jgi:hypothetical protein
MLGDMGVKCESSHFDIKELRESLAGRIVWAKDAGLTQMLVPSLGGPRNPTLDDVKRAADEYNKMGEQSAKAGIQQGLHNEGFELRRDEPGSDEGQRSLPSRSAGLRVRTEPDWMTNPRGPSADAFSRVPAVSHDLRDSVFRMRSWIQ